MAASAWALDGMTGRHLLSVHKRLVSRDLPIPLAVLFMTEQTKALSAAAQTCLPG